MNDDLKSKFFQELATTELFQAQLALEQETYNSLLSKLLSIDLTEDSVHLEYAKLRGSLEVLKSLKANRDRLVERARSRQTNS